MRTYSWTRLAILCMAAVSLHGQTTVINASRQARLESGAQLPQHCSAGQLYVLTNAPVGSNLFLCARTDSWSAVGVPPLGGDASGTQLAVKVQGIQGRGVGAAAPADHDVLQWDAKAGMWLPAQPDGLISGTGVSIAGTVVSVEDAIVPMYYAGAGTPTIPCVVGRDFYVDTNAGDLYFCPATSTWKVVSLPGHVHTAQDITSGTLPAQRLPAAVVMNNQANTFGAGLRQSVSHDAVNAGLRLVPAAGDPSGVQNGDIWYNSSTGKFRRYQNGVALDWDVAGANITNQSNVFGAGLRQSMSHDASNAGLRIVPAAGDPANAQDGDIWYNSTTGKFRRRQGGVALDWDVAGANITNQSNVFGAGLRQSVSHDASNAGLRIVPAAGDPANAQDGDIWYNSTTGKFRRRQGGVALDWDATFNGRSFDPQDTTFYWLYDNFVAGGNNFSTTSFGRLGWTQTSISSGCGSNTWQSPNGFTSPIRFGAVTFRTGTSANTGCVAGLDGNNGILNFPNLSAATWQEQWTWIPEPAMASSNFILRAGHGAGYANTANSALPTSGVFIRVDPATSANFQFDLVVSGSLTSIDSGIAYDNTASTYTFKLRGDGSKFYYSVSKNGGAFSVEKTLCPSSCDITAALPTAGSSPFFQIYHGPAADSAEKRVYMHRYSFTATGVN